MLAIGYSVSMENVNRYTAAGGHISRAVSGKKRLAFRPARGK